MKRITVLLTVLALFTISASQALGQCHVKRHFPNYKAAVDGYAPADYDGDGKADWSIKDFSGAWTIDYSSNGLSGYDQTFFGYGGQSNIPVPDDYDGDGMIDLAVKSDTQGSWNIDYASNGFGSWDATYFGYGGSDNRPVPSDYDGDGKADLSVKASSSGKWNIDYAANGFGSWDVSLNGYGGSQNIPVPADYDGDGKTDLAVWDSVGGGTFDIDFAYNGFGTWDTAHPNLLPYVGRPAVGDFNGDSLMDFSVKGDDGIWRILYQDPPGNLLFPCNHSFFNLGHIVSYAGYGDQFHRPVPHVYGVANFTTDLAVRKESAPSSVAIDFATGGFGAWDFVYSP